MLRGQYDDERLLRKLYDLDVVCGGRVLVFAHVTHDEFEFTPEQRGQQIPGGPRHDTHLDSVVLCGKRPNRTGQQRVRRIGSRSDPDVTCRTSTQTLRFLLEGKHRVEHVASALDQPFGSVGRLDGMSRAVEKPLTKIGLQLFQTSTESGLSHGVFLRRLHKAPQSIERLEVLKLSELHRTTPALTRTD